MTDITESEIGGDVPDSTQPEPAATETDTPETEDVTEAYQKKFALSHLTALVGLLTVVVLTGFGVKTIADLHEMAGLAEYASSTTIPKAAVRQQLAQSALQLNLYAERAIRAASATKRSEVVSKARAVAAATANFGSDSEKEAIERAVRIIERIAASGDKSDILRTKIERQLLLLQSAIGEADNRLGAITAETAFLLKDTIGGLQATSADTIGAAKEEVAEIAKQNTAAYDLLTTLRDMRAVLDRAQRLDDEAKIKKQAVQFDALAKKLQPLVDVLPTGGDFEDLSDEINVFMGFSRIFDLRGSLLRELVKAEEINENATQALSSQVETFSSEAEDALAATVGSGRRIAASAEAVRFTNLLIVGGIILFALAIGLLFRANVLKPVSAATRVLEALKIGDVDQDLPPMKLREFESIRFSLKGFRQALIDNRRMAEDKAESDSRAKEERRKALHGLADSFESHVQGIVNSVTTAAAGIESLAKSMSSTAEETARQAAMVASAAEEASTNVQTVASASEQIVGSTQEIGRHLARSTEVSSEGVTKAKSANDKVQGLSDAAQAIGDVVNLINTIADQTNLLALNATIEAARAGDAGKGFAVVANEVKTLANQTAKATDQIASQIAAIQAATNGAVGAIQGIGGTIGEMSDLSTAIAGAVEEQRATTEEIARSTVQAAKGTGEVSGNISDVNRMAEETGEAAAKVFTAAAELSTQSEALHGEVDKFLASVRAS